MALDNTTDELAFSVHGAVRLDETDGLGLTIVVEPGLPGGRFVEPPPAA